MLRDDQLSSTTTDNHTHTRFADITLDSLTAMPATDINAYLLASNMVLSKTDKEQLDHRTRISKLEKLLKGQELKLAEQSEAIDRLVAEQKKLVAEQKKSARTQFEQAKTIEMLTHYLDLDLAPMTQPCNNNLNTTYPGTVVTEAGGLLEDQDSLTQWSTDTDAGGLLEDQHSLTRSLTANRQWSTGTEAEGLLEDQDSLKRTTPLSSTSAGLWSTSKARKTSSAQDATESTRPQPVGGNK